MLGRRALPARRLARLGATPDVHHGRLAAALSIGFALGLQPTEGTAVLKGRIVDAISGKPLGGAAIRASYEPRPPATYDMRPPDRTARTDRNGAFEMTGLTAGDYSVSGSVLTPGNSYLEIAYGIRRPGGQSSHLTVAEGERLDITMRAWPVASLTGHVIDERGRPVVGVQVRLLSKDNEKYGNATTDDLGAYRITGLPPGRYSTFVPVVGENRTVNPMPVPRPPAAYPQPLFPYLVDRGERTILYNHSVPLPPPSESGQANVFVSSYYGGNSPADAIYLPLSAGEERGDVEITLRARRGHRVAGIATVASGSVAGVIVTLEPIGSTGPQDHGQLTATATAAGDGTFVFVAVPEGAYTLAARRRGPPPTEVSLSGGVPAIAQDDYIFGDPDGLGAEMPFTIGDADIDGLMVNLGPGTRISGRAIFDNGSFDPRTMELGVYLARMANDSFGEGTRMLTLAADGSISGNLQPGTYSLRVQPVPRDWSFNGATVNGRDVGDGPIAVGADPIGDLELVFSRAGTRLSGAIAAPERPPMADTTVVAFASDRAAWPGVRSADSLRAKSVTARDGQYEITELVPGEYFVVAVDENFSSTALTLPLLAQLAEGAARIQLEPGRPATLTLTPRSINP